MRARVALLAVLAVLAAGTWALAGAELAQASEPMPDCSTLTVAQCYTAVQAAAPDVPILLVAADVASAESAATAPDVSYADGTTAAGTDLTGGEAVIVEVASAVQHSGTTPNGYECLGGGGPSGYYCVDEVGPAAPYAAYDGVGVLYDITPVAASIVSELGQNLPVVLLIVGAVIALCVAVRAVHRWHRV